MLHLNIIKVKTPEDVAVVADAQPWATKRP